MTPTLVPLLMRAVEAALPGIRRRHRHPRSQRASSNSEGSVAQHPVHMGSIISLQLQRPRRGLS
jgi:hypothetical protein